MSAITDFFKRAPRRPSEVVTDLQSDFTNREKDEVAKILTEKEDNPKKRGKYRTWDSSQKLAIGTYATRHGNAAALRHYSREFPVISRQSISDFKKVCI